MNHRQRRQHQRVPGEPGDLSRGKRLGQQSALAFRFTRLTGILAGAPALDEQRHIVILERSDGNLLKAMRACFARQSLRPGRHHNPALTVAMRHLAQQLRHPLAAAFARGFVETVQQQYRFFVAQLRFEEPLARAPLQRGEEVGQPPGIGLAVGRVLRRLRPQAPGSGYVRVEFGNPHVQGKSALWQLKGCGAAARLAEIERRTAHES